MTAYTNVTEEDWVMAEAEPITPTGKAMWDNPDILADLAGGPTQGDILAIENEARAMALHEACYVEWTRRASASPGIHLTMHDWTAHLRRKPVDSQS